MNRNNKDKKYRKNITLQNKVLMIKKPVTLTRDHLYCFKVVKEPTQKPQTL